MNKIDSVTEMKGNAKKEKLKGAKNDDMPKRTVVDALMTNCLRSAADAAF